MMLMMMMMMTMTMSMTMMTSGEMMVMMTTMTTTTMMMILIIIVLIFMTATMMRVLLIPPEYHKDQLEGYCNEQVGRKTIFVVPPNGLYSTALLPQNSFSHFRHAFRRIEGETLL